MPSSLNDRPNIEHRPVVQGVRTAGGEAQRSSQQPLAAALELHRSGRLDEAETAYREILRKEPSYAEALHLLGVVRLQAGALEEATKLIGRSIDLRPANAKAHQNLGEALRKAGRFEEAEASYRRALELEPGYAKAHGNLGRALFRQGRWDEAEASLRRALELAPGEVRAYLRLADILRRTHRPDEAEALLRRAISVVPDDAELYFDLGVDFLEAGKAHDAVTCFARTLALDAAHDGAKNNLSLALPYLNDPVEAVARARERLANHPEPVEPLRDLGAALWRAGDCSQAWKNLQEALRLDPASASTHYWLGIVARSQDQLGDAAVYHRAAIVLDPANVYAQAAAVSIERGLVSSHGRPRVALHLNQRYHYRILRPVFDALAPQCAAILTPHVEELAAFDPDVVVVAESQSALLRAKLPRAIFVWVRHGLISKNTTCFAARTADFACLTSEASREWYIAQGGQPRRDFWITGYPQLDALFRNHAKTVSLSQPPDRKTVLYAPTWNAGLSSAPLLGERVVELIRAARDDVTIVIKPHPVTGEHHPEWLATWKAAAATHSDVHLVEDSAADVMPYLRAADVLVSDASSVIFEYLALDRPIVLVTNPQRHSAVHFDPNGIEWRWRDVGDEVSDIADLSGAIGAALHNPALRADRRAYYREELFGRYADGHAAERIARKIAELFP